MAPTTYLCSTRWTTQEPSKFLAQLLAGQRLVRAMRSGVAMVLCSLLIGADAAASAARAETAPTNAVLDIGSRLEPMVDDYLVDRLAGMELRLQQPQRAPASENLPVGYYATVIKDGDLYRFYHRDSVPGYNGKQHDGNAGEITGYAESTNGIVWTKPALGLFEINGSRSNNVILAGAPPFSHNFSPFQDQRPGVPPEQRYKALAGVHESGLHAFVSADGIRWRKLREEPVMQSKAFAFDSQNVAFWSDLEQTYLCYFRSWETPQGQLRTISRATSHNFVNWSPPAPTAPNAPAEHLYTSGTHPYFRAPHIYLALPTRFMPDRGESTDIMFMTSRGGNHYNRQFREAFIRPGLDPARWGNRANYAALNVVPTGPAEMSIYTLSGRYFLRTDGFASVHAGYRAGEMLTHPLRFRGTRLRLNLATSAAGSIRVEIQDESGRPLDGFRLSEATNLVGDQLDRVVSWKSGDSVASLAGRAIRLRFVMQDADLFALQFR